MMFNAVAFFFACVVLWLSPITLYNVVGSLVIAISQASVCKMAPFLM